MISWEYSEEIPPGLLSHEDARHGSETNLEFHQQAEILRTHMLEAANGKTGRCLVVGAGLCEDVPLEQLVEQFSEVHLLDVRAIRPPVDSDKVELHQEDISSVVTMTLRELNQLPRAAEPCRQSALAAEALDRCDEPLTGTWEGLGKFDFIASTLVLSQLGRPVQTYLHQQFVPQSALLKQAYGSWANAGAKVLSSPDRKPGECRRPLLSFHDPKPPGQR